MANPNIYFPILRELRVTGFSMYPQGLDLRFPDGVVVVVGINGIGKTTLLNLIFRLLVGPYAPKKAGDEIQLTQTELRREKHFVYFKNRDRVEGVHSEAEAVFNFGTTKLLVRRHLSDLRILRLCMNGQDLPLDGLSADQSEEPIWSASGCGSQYDFNLLVRRLIFFLEKKEPVIWEPMAQVELFRVLFLDAAKAIQLADLASNIQQLDSRRRNLIDQLKRYKERLAKVVTGNSVSFDPGQRYSHLNERLQALRPRLMEMDDALGAIEKRRHVIRQNLENTKLRAEESERQLEFLHQQYFTSLFPTLTETVRNVFGGLVSGRGCTVCGSRKPGLDEHFQRIAAEGICPVCQSTRSEQEVVEQAVDFATAGIAKANETVKRLRAEIRDLEGVLKEAEKDRIEFIQGITALDAEVRVLDDELNAIRPFVPVEDSEQKKRESFIEISEGQIKEYDRALGSAQEDYNRKLVEFRSQVESIKTLLGKSFREYAKSFLAETCNLTPSESKLRLGQATEEIAFPTFAVQMTSGVTTQGGTTRTTSDDVSESQKEFIDLAFRMAVITCYSALVADRRSAMLVVETPEASLDSLFVGNAGKLIRSFGTGGGLMLCSCNLNRENMIGSLLGLRLEDAPHPSQDEIAQRVINLLELAAPNAAIKQHGAQYRAEFLRAISPETADSDLGSEAP